MVAFGGLNRKESLVLRVRISCRVASGHCQLAEATVVSLQTTPHRHVQLQVFAERAVPVWVISVAADIVIRCNQTVIHCLELMPEGRMMARVGA